MSESTSYTRDDNNHGFLKQGRQTGGSHWAMMEEATSLDHLAVQRGLPQAIFTDNCEECCGRPMLTWTHTRGVRLFLIQAGKHNKNAYIELFNGRLQRWIPE